LWVPCSTKHLNSIVSSYQSNSLLPGFSLRLATKNDVMNILYFEFIDEGRYIDGLLFVMFVTIILTLVGIIFNLPAMLGVAILLGFILAFLLRFLIASQEYTDSIDRDILCVWLIEFRNKVRGCLAFRDLGEYIFITRLLIGSNHQNNGLGSYLISHCIRAAVKNTYLTCHDNLKYFYRRRGFVDVDYSAVPAELLSWRKHRSLNLMVFRPEGQTQSY
jgi:N-acetylglutamate synthase-like GNAT family acetyltransferase